MEEKSQSSIGDNIMPQSVSSTLVTKKMLTWYFSLCHYRTTNYRKRKQMTLMDRLRVAFFLNLVFFTSLFMAPYLTSFMNLITSISIFLSFPNGHCLFWVVLMLSHWGFGHLYLSLLFPRPETLTHSAYIASPGQCREARCVLEDVCCFAPIHR